jgi:hypothetical protein
MWLTRGAWTAIHFAIRARSRRPAVLADVSQHTLLGLAAPRSCLSSNCFELYPPNKAMSTRTCRPRRANSDHATYYKRSRKTYPVPAICWTRARRNNAAAAPTQLAAASALRAESIKCSLNEFQLRAYVNFALR